MKRSIWGTKTSFWRPFWEPLGAPWDPLGTPWGPLGDPLGPLGDHLGPFLVHFGPFGGLCGHPGPPQRHIFNIFEVFRSAFEHFLTGSVLLCGSSLSCNALPVPLLRQVHLDPSGSCYLLHGSSILRKSHVFMISGSSYLLGNIAI